MSVDRPAAAANQLGRGGRQSAGHPMRLQGLLDPTALAPTNALSWGDPLSHSLRATMLGAVRLWNRLHVKVKISFFG